MSEDAQVSEVVSVDSRDLHILEKEEVSPRERERGDYLQITK